MNLYGFCMILFKCVQTDYTIYSRIRRDAGMESQNSNLNFIIEIAKSLTVFTERPFLKGEFE